MKNQIIPTVIGAFCIGAFTATALVIQETIDKGNAGHGATREMYFSRLPMMFLLLFLCLFVFVMIITIIYGEYKASKAEKQLRDLKNELDLNSYETTLGQAE